MWSEREFDLVVIPSPSWGFNSVCIGRWTHWHKIITTWDNEILCTVQISFYCDKDQGSFHEKGVTATVLTGEDGGKHSPLLSIAQRKKEAFWSLSIQRYHQLNTPFPLIKISIETCRHNQHWGMKELCWSWLISLHTELRGIQFSNSCVILMMNISEREVWGLYLFKNGPRLSLVWCKDLTQDDEKTFVACVTVHSTTTK